ncbi:hypothetical protein [Lichenicoccus roseus]|uniref:Uncharacterized protein n=1 Tax=Lichenicoccus roseus TaxID=2683649 RepID=A0A5R9JGK0_9PROT|nr:hypothetical protein [Lichenicoccus roseus]TLU73418.1 hypothetical protein FE263_08485 [Lichenicoccus roseus]
MMRRYGLRLALKLATPALLLTGATLLRSPLAHAAGSTDAFTHTVNAIPLDNVALPTGYVLQAHAQVLRPAPLPDPDVSAPGPSRESLEAQASPSVSPDLFNPRAHIAGDGYAAGSSIDTDHNNRHSTGGGMSLSIPMQ